MACTRREALAAHDATEAAVTQSRARLGRLLEQYVFDQQQAFTRTNALKAGKLGSACLGRCTSGQIFAVLPEHFTLGLGPPMGHEVSFSGVCTFLEEQACVAQSKGAFLHLMCLSLVVMAANTRWSAA